MNKNWLNWSLLWTKVHFIFFFFFLFLPQACLSICSQKATGSPSPQEQTTCTLLWNTLSQSCGPSPSVCGCGPQTLASGRHCPTLFLSRPMKWCWCKACTHLLSCSLMTRYGDGTVFYPHMWIEWQHSIYWKCQNLSSGILAWHHTPWCKTLSDLSALCVPRWHNYLWICPEGAGSTSVWAGTIREEHGRPIRVGSWGARAML